MDCVEKDILTDSKPAATSNQQQQRTTESRKAAKRAPHAKVDKK